MFAKFFKSSSSPETSPENEVAPPPSSEESVNEPDKGSRHPALSHWDSHARRSRFLLILLVVTVVASVGIQYGTVRAIHNSRYVVVLDSSDTFYVSPLEADDLKSPVFARTAIMAAEVILNRTQSGLKLPELARGLLGESARTKLDEDLKSQNEDMVAKQMIWEPVVRSTTAMREVEGLRVYQVRGELVRIGVVGGGPFIDPVKFDLVLAMEPNPNLGQRGQFPFVVTNYRVTFDALEND